MGIPLVRPSLAAGLLGLCGSAVCHAQTSGVLQATVTVVDAANSTRANARALRAASRAADAPSRTPVLDDGARDDAGVGVQVDRAVLLAGPDDRTRPALRVTVVYY